MKIAKVLRITMITAAVATTAFGTYLGVKAVAGTDTPAADVKTTDISSGASAPLATTAPAPQEQTPEPTPSTEPAPAEPQAPAETPSPTPTPTPEPSRTAGVIYPNKPDGTPTTTPYYEVQMSTFDSE